MLKHLFLASAALAATPAWAADAPAGAPEDQQAAPAPIDQPQGGMTTMWVRQCDLDAGSDFLPPIPSRIASNEEFVPPPQSAEQKEYEDRLADLSERAAKRQGR